MPERTGKVWLDSGVADTLKSWGNIEQTVAKMIHNQNITSDMRMIRLRRVSESCFKKKSTEWIVAKVVG